MRARPPCSTTWSVPAWRSSGSPGRAAPPCAAPSVPRHEAARSPPASPERSRRRSGKDLQAQLVEVPGEELGIVEHPVVVDAPVARRAPGNRAGGVQVAGEGLAVGALQDGV